jgi:hypothetical protein
MKRRLYRAQQRDAGDGAESHAIDGQVGLISITRDIALYQGKPVVHDCLEVGTSNLSTRGDDVLGAYVNPIPVDTFDDCVSHTSRWLRSQDLPQRLVDSSF